MIIVIDGAVVDKFDTLKESDFEKLENWGYLYHFEDNTPIKTVLDSTLEEFSQWVNDTAEFGEEFNRIYYVGNWDRNTELVEGWESYNFTMRVEYHYNYEKG